MLARHTDLEVRVVDIGVAYDFGSVQAHSKKSPTGDGNLRREPAMSRTDAVQAMQVGLDLATEAAREEHRAHRYR